MRLDLASGYMEMVEADCISTVTETGLNANAIQIFQKACRYSIFN